ncbi:MAG: polysulfide reductase NrfD [Eggerthellaceae bacterium]|nr:polysulfide reductase NrfD [Eggerthellaceae bacterium]
MNNVGVIDDDFNPAAAPRAKEAAGAKAVAWGGKGVNVGIGVAGVLVVVGIALWGVQLAGGMVQTGMRNLDSWGLYITMFMFFVGLSAGGLIFSSVPMAFLFWGFGGF